MTTTRPTRNQIGEAPAPSGAPAGAESAPPAENVITIRARSPRGFAVSVALKNAGMNRVEAVEAELLRRGYQLE